MGELSYPIPSKFGRRNAHIKSKCSYGHFVRKLFSHGRSYKNEKGRDHEDVSFAKVMLRQPIRSCSSALTLVKYGTCAQGDSESL